MMRSQIRLSVLMALCIVLPAVAINPGKPYTRQVPVPAGIDEHDLVASISDGGRELVSYSPIRLTPEQAPPGVTNPPAPADVKTNEELYLIGLRAQQFHDPANDPMPYWEEALRRDPGDSRVNTVLGITAYTNAKYAEAEKYLRTAIARVTAQFTDPKDVEAIYYLGATLKVEGKTDEAIKMMTGRKFAVAEGANLNVSDQWTNAHILRGQQKIAAQRYQEALVDLQTAVTVPDNLPSRGFGGGGARNAEVAYLTGLAYEGLGDRAKATESWNRATAPAQSGVAAWEAAVLSQQAGLNPTTRRFAWRSWARPTRPGQCSRAWWTPANSRSKRRRPQKPAAAAEAAQDSHRASGQPTRIT